MDNKPAGATDYLANERTFLARIRTSIALLWFGFVLVKFVLFVRQLSLALHAPVGMQAKGYPAEIGVVMVILGALLAILAFLRYRQVEKQLNHQQYFPSVWLSALVTAVLLIVNVFLVWYLLPNLWSVGEKRGE